MTERLMTSESVTDGHPDKVADQISDAVLDAVLRGDPAGRVACDCLVAQGLVVVAGQISTVAAIDPAETARAVVREVGYSAEAHGLDPEACEVRVALTQQSLEIAAGVARSLEERAGVGAGRFAAQGAGDQGLMIGYATEETPELMPLPHVLASGLCRRLAEARRGDLPFLGPDGKAQVTVRYDGARSVAVQAVVVSTQHARGVAAADLHEAVVDGVVRPVLEERGLWRRDLLVHVNPAGSFEIGGPTADCGLTGRKIVVDTYGGAARHGGGAFSGKDPSKVDRSGAYAARWAAKSVVAAGLAARCEVGVAYSIGVARPIAVTVDCLGSERRDPAAVERWVRERFDLRPAAIVEALDLLRPIYRKTAVFGHFGRDDPDFTWERPQPAS